MTRHLLRSALGDSAHVLVVGSGSGEEAVGLAAEEPGWRVTGVDPSPDMTRIARHRLANANLTDRVALHTGLLQDLPEEAP